MGESKIPARLVTILFLSRESKDDITEKIRASGALEVLANTIKMELGFIQIHFTETDLDEYFHPPSEAAN